jgi:hypothetical protein
MNNSNVPAVLRSLIIYAVCIPLAMFVGYLLANQQDYGSLGFYGVLAVVLCSPILLRWHRELLVFSWSASLSVFILPGKPNLWLVMVAVSLGISVLERIMNSANHFIRVPQITWPLLAFLAVALFTAEMTGGVGLHAFGSAVYGGKKYVYLFVSIASYFALTARPIPKEKARVFVILFFLGRATDFVGNLYPICPSWMNPLFYLFPPTVAQDADFQVGITRLAGFCNVGLAISFLMMARFGLRGIFLSGKPWRILYLMAAFGLIFLGGYRSWLLLFLATFTGMFFWEGLHRTPILLVMILLGALGGTALVPLANKLPYTFQRSLAFLPLDLDADARMSAEDSTEWRLNMWAALLPQIPPHLFLGKGLAVTAEDYDEMMTGNTILNTAAANVDDSQNSLALSSDFHNGMLSIIIPFGIWGVMAVVWFFFAGLKVLYNNARYGRPDLQLTNAFLLMLFAWEVLNYLSCFGGMQISLELATFVGFLGLSIALNNGVCQPADQVVENRPAVVPYRALLRPRPAFQR